jgi:hypothetical protein
MQYCLGKILEALRVIEVGKVICWDKGSLDGINLRALQMRIYYQLGDNIGAEVIERELRIEL